MYYRNFNNNRLVGPGSFILPFALGFATAPLVLKPKQTYYPYPYYYPYYPYYQNYYHY